MSYANIPAIDALQNGFPINADFINAAFGALSDCARTLSGDFLGSPVVVDGGEVDTVVEGDDQFAEIDQVTAYVFEDGTLPNLAIREATRLRHPADRRVRLANNEETLVALRPSNLDSRFAAPTAYRSSQIPTAGVVPLAWVATSHLGTLVIVDARPNPRWGVYVSSGGDEIRSRRIVAINDSKFAAVLGVGEQLEIRVEAKITDGLIDELPNTRIVQNRNDTGRFALSYNGVYDWSDGTPMSIGFASSWPNARYIFAEWLFSPSDVGSRPVFPTAALIGAVMVEVMGRGIRCTIDDLHVYARVRPAEKVPT